MPKFFRHLNKFYVLAEEDEVPTESDMVKEIEEEPATGWREEYLQPLIRLIRSKFDLDKGEVSLLAVRKDNPYGDDSLGFDITGQIKFKSFVPDIEEYGRAPYRFTVSVDTNGKLSSYVEVEGY